MSLRQKIKNKISKFLDQLSGEHSEAAPEELIPYSKGEPDENANVVMARLNRPKGSKDSTSASASPSSPSAESQPQNSPQ
ncbi:MAG: hypothetical protein CMK59_05960 [Proteobacteria bacterium]|nr:hypothetical protein [Pseudomonadota bacterium]